VAATVPDQINVFDRFMDSQFLPADGFDLPVRPDRSAWRLSTPFGQGHTHGINPGEDWSRNTGGGAEHAQQIRAVANGRVFLAENVGEAMGNVIIIEHAFYENNERRTIRSFYSRLKEIKVQPGEEVRKRQPIATSDAQLHFELRWDEKLSSTFWPSSEGKGLAWIKEHYAPPGDFIEHHRFLPVPQQETTLVLVDQSSYKIRIYDKGQLKGEYDVSFGQGKGQKRVKGQQNTQGYVLRDTEAPG
jgi:murein DD-endopeptidase MepM/ murein hydrolase activator NlpD